jgi:hypothetical protein
MSLAHLFAMLARPTAKFRPALTTALLMLAAAGCQQDLPSPAANGNTATDNTAANDNPESAAAPGQPPPPGDLFATFGFALEPPTGWTQDAETSVVHFAARWLPVDSPEGDISQFTVQVTPSRFGSFDQLVQNTNVPAEYSSSRIELDGQPALEIRHPRMAVLIGGERQLLGPVVVCLHQGNEYRLAFLLDSRDEIAAARRVIDSWRWIPIERPFVQFALGAERELLDGRLVMQLPVAARQDIQLVTSLTDSFIVFDYAGRQDALVLGAEWVEASGKSLQQQVFAYAEQIERNTRLSALLNFSPLEGSPHVMVSEPMIGEFASEAGPVRRTSRYAVCELAPGRFAHLQFVVNDEVVTSASDRQVVDRTINASLASTRPGRATKQPTSRSESPPELSGESAEVETSR